MAIGGCRLGKDLFVSVRRMLTVTCVVPLLLVAACQADEPEPKLPTPSPSTSSTSATDDHAHG